MSEVTLTVAEGKPAIEIADAKGEVWVYQFRVERRPGSWTCSLRKLGEQTYTVYETHGRYVCDCKAWEFSKDRWGAGCKHTRACRDLRQLLEAMHGETEAQEEARPA